jgi:hypothetical protein
LEADMCLSQWEEIASIIASGATVVGLILGGVWTYWLFVQHRQRYPRARIEHRIRHWRAGEGKTLLHIDVTISNVGSVLISLVESRTTIQQVLPVADSLREMIAAGRELVESGKSEVDWPTIAEHEVQYEKDECEIEPDETQGIEYDFVVNDDVRTVQVYSYVMNEKKRKKELSWDLTTLYNITDSKST